MSQLATPSVKSILNLRLRFLVYLSITNIIFKLAFVCKRMICFNTNAFLACCIWYNSLVLLRLLQLSKLSSFTQACLSHPLYKTSLKGRCRGWQGWLVTLREGKNYITKNVTFQTTLLANERFDHGVTFATNHHCKLSQKSHLFTEWVLHFHLHEMR